jgi:hypothetical protein
VVCFRGKGLFPSSVWDPWWNRAAQGAGLLINRSKVKSLMILRPKKEKTDPILEVAVWSKPCGRYRGPLPRGKAVQVKACDISAAFALSRRTIRYSSVEKHAVFGPKMVADDIVPRSLALREAGLKRRAGLACPWRRLRPSSCHGDF